jgi:hypothetical protein
MTLIEVTAVSKWLKNMGYDCGIRFQSDIVRGKNYILVFVESYEEIGLNYTPHFIKNKKVLLKH